MAGQPALRLQQPQALVAIIPASKWIRIAGYLIDVLPAMVLGLVSLVPVVGLIFAGLLLTPYWLLRDVGGRSLGKLLLGLKIVKQTGHPAPTGARIARNLPLIAAPICMMIPFLGYVLVIPVALIVLFVEGIMLLTQDSRLGDKMAGTVVVKN